MCLSHCVVVVVVVVVECLADWFMLCRRRRPRWVYSLVCAVSVFAASVSHSVYQFLSCLSRCVLCVCHTVLKCISHTAPQWSHGVSSW